MSSTLNVPPTFKFSPIPTPPTTVSAPVSVEVEEIHKVIPSMNDIFIKAVGGEIGGNNE